MRLAEVCATRLFSGGIDFVRPAEVCAQRHSSVRASILCISQRFVRNDCSESIDVVLLGQGDGAIVMMFWRIARSNDVLANRAVKLSARSSSDRIPLSMFS